MPLALLELEMTGQLYNLRNLLPRLLGVVVVGGLAVLAAVSWEKQQQAKEFFAEISQVIVAPPMGIPKLEQASIDLALEMYSIKVPSSALRPIYDANLEDRGLTIRHGYFRTAHVRIGKAAFSSWALLASTLAHELEVHCEQSFLLIAMLDGLGLEGTAAAEREAYRYEIKNAERFGLERFDANLISETLNYYFPERNDAGQTALVSQRRLGSWLSSRLLTISK